jgi:ferrous iron transport protein B
VEDAQKKGIQIDSEKLEKLLNIPVVPINPITKKGIDKLVELIPVIRETAKRSFQIEYDDHIEQAVSDISPQVEGKLPKRFVALRVLEEDKDFYGYLKDSRVIKSVKEGLNDHPNVARDISITRYGTASFIAEHITQITHLERKKQFQEKIDDVLLHKNWGPLTTGLFLLALFGLLLFLGSFVQGILMELTENFLSSLIIDESSIVALILVQGLTGVAAGISIALPYVFLFYPYVFLFYLFLGVLEDTGMLSRFIVNAERFLKKLGLPGKAFIPLALGLGCTVPAVRATRVLSSKKEQFHTASLFAFVPCSSRTAIIMGVVGFYGGIMLAFFVLVTALVAGLIWAFGIKKVFHVRSEPLLLELPLYRRPLIKNVAAKSWIRMKDFVYIVIPLLAIGGMAYGILDTIGLAAVVVEPLSPITTWLGLPAVVIIPLLFGFLQKDLTGGMLVSVLGIELSLALTSLQIYTFGVAAIIGIPCIIAFGMLAKEFGFKRSMLLTVTSIGYGLLVAGLAWRIISLF